MKVSAQRRRGFVAVVALLSICAVLLGACGGPKEETAYKRQLFAMGTVIEVSLWGVDEARAAEAVRAVEAVLNDAHVRWHAWEPGELTRLNAALGEGRGAEVSAETAAALRRAQELATASGQLFNPAIGRLVGLWGFHSSEPPLGPPPPRDAIVALIEAAPGMDGLRIEDGRVEGDDPAVQLDLGAFAKGYAVDRAIEALRALGIDNAIVNAGGDLRAIGSHGERPWRIGIRQPASQGGIFASIETHGDESVFTSGNYERYFDHEGRRYHHILDPRTGYPAQHTLSVTVIHGEAAAADAAATALFVAGPGEWAPLARRMGISQVMLIDADMKVYMSPEMARRVRFEAQPAPETIIVDEAG